MFLEMFMLKSALEVAIGIYMKHHADIPHLVQHIVQLSITVQGIPLALTKEVVVVTGLVRLLLDKVVTYVAVALRAVIPEGTHPVIFILPPAATGTTQA
jgi:hypothetical protein